MDHYKEITVAGKRMTNQTHSKRITCNEALSLIALYLDEQASDNERTALQEHFETCRHCFDRAEFERLLRERVKRLQPQGASDRLRKRIDSLLNNF